MSKKCKKNYRKVRKGKITKTCLFDPLRFWLTLREHFCLFYVSQSA